MHLSILYHQGLWKAMNTESARQVTNRPRKITLFNGHETLSELVIPVQQSNRDAMRVIETELGRTPVLTHAIFRDRNGTEWMVRRDIGILQKLRILLLSK
ncbi:hypothetical protein CWE22_05325 [Pseudidiomarina aestuarii]|uniref:Uncharacterized protein n=2 Tax=Pseudidiomarina aestuarii TaxID=624146 RepID=A0A7Z6ZUJ8_9GAMM|nr:hypothetical protein CWE22_05325 [Pseudidiomarina aestuarii]